VSAVVGWPELRELLSSTWPFIAGLLRSGSAPVGASLKHFTLNRKDWLSVCRVTGAWSERANL